MSLEDIHYGGRAIDESLIREMSTNELARSIGYNYRTLATGNAQQKDYSPDELIVPELDTTIRYKQVNELSDITPDLLFWGQFDGRYHRPYRSEPLPVSRRGFVHRLGSAAHLAGESVLSREGLIVKPILARSAIDLTTESYRMIRVDPPLQAEELDHELQKLNDRVRGAEDRARQRYDRLMGIAQEILDQNLCKFVQVLRVEKTEEVWGDEWQFEPDTEQVFSHYKHLERVFPDAEAAALAVIWPDSQPSSSLLPLEDQGPEGWSRYVEEQKTLSRNENAEYEPQDN